MKGRLEHELRSKNNIDILLKTMPEYVTEYYYNIHIDKEPSSCLEYLRKINNFLKFIDMDISKIDDIIVGKYFESIDYTEDISGEVRKTSFAYHQQIWSVLNQFFIFLKRKNYIENNPLESTKRPPKKDNVKRIFLSMEDLNGILESVKNGAGSQRAKARQREWIDRDLLILFLFMNTGMRKTALSEINVSDIDFASKELTVTDKRNKTQIYVITEEMEYAIKNWLIKREELLNGIDNEALFISSFRQRMSEKAVYNLVKKYSQDVLENPISPHKLRAAFASLFYEASGGDIKATCEAVGHSDISTTSIYVVKKNNSRKEAQSFMSEKLKIF